MLTEDQGFFGVLDDELVAHVFSFLGGGDKMKNSDTRPLAPASWMYQYTAMKEGSLPVSSTLAGQLYRQLAYVCKRWHRVCDANMAAISGLVSFRIDVRKWDQSKLQWICRRRLRIGFLDVFVDEHRPSPALTQILKVAEACATTEFTRMVRLFVAANPGTICPQLQIDLHSAIAEHFPNLEQLSMNFIQPYPPAEVPRDIYQLLFSLPNLRELDLSLVLPRPVRGASANLSMLTDPLANLDKLKKLKLRGGFNSKEGIPRLVHRAMLVSSDEESVDAAPRVQRAPQSEWLTPFMTAVNLRLVIESKSLAVLDVSGLESGMWVKCKCPLLETFVCRLGQNHTNGSLPILTQEHLENTPQMWRRNLVVTAQEMPFLGLDVPSTCVLNAVRFQEFIRTINFEQYTDLRRFVDDVQSWS